MREDYAVGVSVAGRYRRIFTSYPDTEEMSVTAKKSECDGRPYRLDFPLRANEAVIFAFPKGK